MSDTAGRWYLVGALPEDSPAAHLMTRSEDLRYRRSACGDKESRMWTPVDLTGTDVVPCPRCAATLPSHRSTRKAEPAPNTQLAFDLPL
ncbi:hypothetical protein BS329_32115 [Amycolatopsis coloradensis]|uniref:Uncharacterized protein n=1 Tax=Amycolatopsis coloradensis TaxID=76021 RepID=A0A1R0KIL3_9PSEU|nr:hypothetical protein [Amycolatopsis coloradensis]OLZ45689.1 hypothetical protein BS329_32115 [Amycolatopsis coloradensis]